MSFSPSCTRAAKLTGAADGQIFVETQPLQFSISEARGAVALQLREYSGRVAWEGKSEAPSVSIPPQAPGWYELVARDESGETTTALGVVMRNAWQQNQPTANLPREGRINVDVAGAWLLAEGKRAPVARMMRRAGIPWARERFTWTSSEKTRGNFALEKRYTDAARAYQEAGIHVLQMWHDAPAWTRPGREKNGAAPDDLRDLYRFTQWAADQFPQMRAWEVWNEADIGFFPELSDRFSGVQKAAYWGFRDSKSKPRVLTVSFAHPASAFTRHFFANGSGDYADIYNWHRYADPKVYPLELHNHRQAARENGAAAKTWWMTEAGIPLVAGEGENKRALSMDDLRRQASFVPRAATMALEAGNEKYFFFVLPDYWENGNQFGVLRPDLSPNPAFLALSAAANLLGLADYAGQVQTPSAITARVFDTSRGRLVVAWSETPQKLSLPASDEVKIFNMFGAVSTQNAQNGRVEMNVGPEAVYILGAQPAVIAPDSRTLPPSVLKKTTAPAIAKLNQPSRVVLVGFSDLPVDKGRDAYILGSRVARSNDNAAGGAPSDSVQFEKVALNTPVVYTVQAYNFDERKNHRGTVSVHVPASWKVEPKEASVQLAPMERRVLSFTITPSEGSPLNNIVKVQGKFTGENVAPSLSVFALDPGGLKPIRTRRLEWVNPALWDGSNTSPAGKTEVTRTPLGVLRFATTFTEPGDRWAYPSQRFATPQDFSGFDGLAFDGRSESDAPGASVRLMIIEKSGALYMSNPIVADSKSNRAVVLFRDLGWAPFGTADPNGKLDLNEISEVRLGYNASGNTMSLETENFDLVQFAPER